MAFDQLKSEIMMLFADMENQPEDVWELHETIREKLMELKSFGMPLPEDLVMLERKLDAELAKRGS
jgi:predicted  nucleic acid-binding Zn-ribbon protein